MQDRALYAAVAGQVIQRLRSGQSQASLAVKAGLSQSALSRFENGQSLPDMYETRQLAAALNRTHGEFVQLVEDAVVRTRRVVQQVQPQTDWNAIAAATLGAFAVIAVVSILEDVDKPAPKERKKST